MTDNRQEPDARSQSEKFKQMARDVGAETDKIRRKERPRKVAEAGPANTPE